MACCGIQFPGPEIKPGPCIGSTEFSPWPPGVSSMFSVQKKQVLKEERREASKEVASQSSRAQEWKSRLTCIVEMKDPWALRCSDCENEKTVVSYDLQVVGSIYFGECMGNVERFVKSIGYVPAGGFGRRTRDDRMTRCMGEVSLQGWLTFKMPRASRLRSRHWRERALGKHSWRASPAPRKSSELLKTSRCLGSGGLGPALWGMYVWCFINSLKRLHSKIMHVKPLVHYLAQNGKHSVTISHKRELGFTTGVNFVRFFSEGDHLPFSQRCLFYSEPGP